jgi:hypothetical protein
MLSSTPQFKNAALRCRFDVEYDNDVASPSRWFLQFYRETLFQHLLVATHGTRGLKETPGKEGGSPEAAPTTPPR